MKENEVLSESQKKEIAQKLSSIIPTLTCPMCGNHHFTIVDGYFTPTIQKDIQNLQLGGTVMPTVAIVCNNCGFVSSHALGVLGLLPKNENAIDGTK